MQSQLENTLNEPILDISPLGGGSIYESYLVKSATRKLFVKYSPNNTKLIDAEFDGLCKIASTQSIATPLVVNHSNSFLVLEYIESKSPGTKDFKLLGKQLALLHKNYSSCFGYSQDNFIGLNPQINTPVKAFNDYKDWVFFYWENRLRMQWQLAKSKSVSGTELDQKMAKLEYELPNILKDGEEGPCLLHGDLWNGNFLIAQNGTPYLIDPAVYYGHREADLAMTKMFGGFAPEFYKAYNQEYPLRPGWEKRMDIYILYHALNHLNLFGSSYYSQCIRLLDHYLA